MALILSVLAMHPASPAHSGHVSSGGWVHDHSTQGVPSRPHGLTQLNSQFGPACNSAANDARTYFPHAVARYQGGYVYYHPGLARNIGHNIIMHIADDHRNNAIDYGVYGYVCRKKTGSTNYSTHSWGVAVDTNTARNPFGQTYWDGRGADGVNYGSYIPFRWNDEAAVPHMFYWGLRFSGTKDPHHFQYVTGY